MILLFRGSMGGTLMKCWHHMKNLGDEFDALMPWQTFGRLFVIAIYKIWVILVTPLHGRINVLIRQILLKKDWIGSYVLLVGEI